MKNADEYLCGFQCFCQQTADELLPKPIFRGGTLQNMKEDMAKIKLNMPIIMRRFSTETNRLIQEAKLIEGFDVQLFEQSLQSIVNEHLKQLHSK